MKAKENEEEDASCYWKNLRKIEGTLILNRRQYIGCFIMFSVIKKHIKNIKSQRKVKIIYFTSTGKNNMIYT
jgi:hypothetical protein